MIIGAGRMIGGRSAAGYTPPAAETPGLDFSKSDNSQYFSLVF
jgi:hypothetical protein